MILKQMLSLEINVRIRKPLKSWVKLIRNRNTYEIIPSAISMTKIRQHKFTTKVVNIL